MNRACILTALQLAENSISTAQLAGNRCPRLQLPERYSDITVLWVDGLRRAADT